MGIKERKWRQNQERRRLILDTARNLFAENGSSGVTLEAIARSIEFSKGTIYSHFNSKEEIFAQLLLEQLTSLLELLREASAQDGDTAFTIRSCLRIYLDFYRGNREYFKLLFFIDVVSDHYRIPRELLHGITQTKVACLVELQKVIRRGKDSAEIDPSLSQKNVALVLWGMINGIIQLLESGQIREADLEALADIGYRLVIDGLKK